MLGDPTAQLERSDSSWFIDNERKRQVNGLYMDNKLRTVYHPKIFGVRPDLTNHDQSVFHDDIQLAEALRASFQQHLFKESMRMKLYGNCNDYATTKVTTCERGILRPVRDPVSQPNQPDEDNSVLRTRRGHRYVQLRQPNP